MFESSLRAVKLVEGKKEKKEKMRKEAIGFKS